MSSPARSNTVTVTLLAALLAPRLARMTGVPLGVDDVALLIAGSVTVWHAGCAVFERYFPPPNPISPKNSAQEMK